LKLLLAEDDYIQSAAIEKMVARMAVVFSEVKCGLLSDPAIVRDRGSHVGYEEFKTIYSGKNWQKNGGWPLNCSILAVHWRIPHRHWTVIQAINQTRKLNPRRTISWLTPPVPM
jgi:hypothetical protein